MLLRPVAATLVLGLALAVTGPAAAQDAAAGAKSFVRCSICHSVTPGAPNKMGPNLAGVVGRKAGGLPGYKYSPAMAAAGFAWTKPKLDAYLAAPQAVVKGNKMIFPGLTDPKQRADVIAYVATLKG